MRQTTRKILSLLGIVVGGVAGGVLGYGVARAALPKIPSPSRYPEPSPEEYIPLRPEEPQSSDAPRGPLAIQLVDLFEKLDDDELESARRSMPPDWWEHILAAMKTSSDDEFSVTLMPLRTQIEGWTKEQIETLKSDLLSAFGLFKTLELKGILEAGGVL